MYPARANSAANRRAPARNLPALHAALVAEYLDVPYAAFLSKACPFLRNDGFFVKKLIPLSQACPSTV